MGKNGEMQRPVRVCFLIDWLAPAGTELRLVRLIEALDRRRVQPYLWLLKGGDDDCSLAFAPRNCATRCLGVRRLASFRTVGAARRFIGFLRAERIDLLVLYHPDSTRFGVFCGRLAGNLRIVLTRNNAHVIPRGLERLAVRVCQRFAHATLSNSQAGGRASVLYEGASPQRVFVIPNGIRLERFAEIPVWQPNGSPVRRVGVVANLRRIKGIDLFVEAAKSLAARWPDVRFQVAGGGNPGPYRELAAACGVDGQVEFLGEVADVPAFLAGLDVAVLPSRCEGMSNALLEYMAAGRPIVTTRVGGNSEVIANGVHGLLVRPENHHALAAGIEQLLTDPALAVRLAAAARNRAKAFDTENEAARFAGLAMLLAVGQSPAGQTTINPCVTSIGSSRQTDGFGGAAQVSAQVSEPRRGRHDPNRVATSLYAKSQTRSSKNGKHVLRASILKSARLIGVNRTVRMVLRSRLLVLCYHSIIPDDCLLEAYRARGAVRIGALRRQVAILRRLFHVLSPQELLDHLTSGTSLPPYATLITFDDGFRNNLTLAAPVLEALGMRAIVNIVTGYIGRRQLLWTHELGERILGWQSHSLPMPGGGSDLELPDDEAARCEAANLVRRLCMRMPNHQRLAYLERLRQERLPAASSELSELYAFLSCDEVRTLAARGFAIGSHTVTHPILTSLSSDELAYELLESKRTVEDWLGVPCQWFAYPNGGPADLDAEVVKAVRNAGYRGAFALIGRVNPASVTPLRIHRVCVADDLSDDGFEAQLHGFRSIWPAVRPPSDD